MAKENEVQSLHSKLTDTLVSKQQLEQRLMQLMESEQKRVSKEESLQIQVQVFVFLYLKIRGCISLFTCVTVIKKDHEFEREGEKPLERLGEWCNYILI